MGKKVMRRWIPLALAMMCCGAYAGVARASPNVILLGASMQLTGVDANTGHYFRHACQMAINKINE